jgi:hypothetical protein
MTKLTDGQTHTRKLTDGETHMVKLTNAQINENHTEVYSFKIWQSRIWLRYSRSYTGPEVSLHSSQPNTTGPKRIEIKIIYSLTRYPSMIHV